MIRKLIALTLILTALGADPANAGRLRLIAHGSGGSPVGPPAIQTVDMGSETFRGYGGANPCTTYGAATIVSQSNSGGAVSTFAVRSGTNFVAYAGTYGAAAPATSGPYTVNLTCGAYPVTLTVNIAPGRFDVREDPTDTAFTSQPIQVLGKTVAAGGPTCGEEVVFRPGEWNTAQQDRRIEPPADSALAACFTGSNYILVRAETPLATKVGRMIVYGDTGRADTYMHFRDFWISRPNPTMAAQHSGAFEGFAGPRTMKISRSLIESAPGATDGHTVFSGISISGGNVGSCTGVPNALQYASRSQNIVIEDVDVRGVYRGVVVNGSNIQMENIRVSDVWEDGVRLSNVWDVTLRWIYILNQKSLPLADLAHADGIQSVQTGMCEAQGYAAGNYNWGDWYGIMIARGTGSSGLLAGQGIFLADVPVGVYFTNGTFRGIFVQGTLQRGVHLAKFIEPVVEWVTLVQDTSPGITPDTPTAYFEAGVGGTYRYNSTNVVLGMENGQTPLTVDTGNVLITTPNYTTAYTAPTSGASLDNVAGVLAAFSMKPGGPLDGSTNVGALGTGYVDFVNRTTSFPD